MDLTRDSCCQREIERNKKVNAIQRTLQEIDPVRKQEDLRKSALGVDLSSTQDRTVNIDNELLNETESTSDFTDDDAFFESYMAQRMEEMNLKSTLTLIKTESNLLEELKDLQLKECDIVFAIFSQSIEQDKLAESIGSELGSNFSSLSQLKLSAAVEFNLSNWFIGYRQTSKEKPLFCCLKYSLGSLHVLSVVSRDEYIKKNATEIISELKENFQINEKPIQNEESASQVTKGKIFQCEKDGCNKTFSHKHFLAKEMSQDGYY